MTTSAETGAGVPARLVSISKAAEELTAAGDHIDRSALSRYCDTHGLKRGKRGRSVLVDLEEVRAHRAANYTREVMRGEAGQAPASNERGAGCASTASGVPVPHGRSTSDAPPASVSSCSAPSGQPRGETGAGDLGEVVDLDPTRRKRAADAERAEIDLAERKGLILSVEEVEAGIADAISTMRQTFGTTAAEHAGEILAELGMSGEHKRAVRAQLKRYARRAEEKFLERMAKLGSESRVEQSATRRRLEILAEKAARLAEADQAIQREAGL